MIKVLEPNATTLTTLHKEENQLRPFSINCCNFESFMLRNHVGKANK